MKFLTFLQESDGMFSWGRVAGSFTTATAIYLATHIVRATGTIDISVLAGLGAFGIFPFAASKGIAAMAKPTAGQ